MNQNKRFEAIVDGISLLPDEILIHIISFLPLKVAYTTSILSKRWKPLCKFLTLLHFDDKFVNGKEEEYLGFLSTIDSVMRHRQNQPIEAFHLRSKYPPLLFNLDQWIEASNRHGVKDIKLSMFNFFDARLIYYTSLEDSTSMMDRFINVAPNNIFNCRTLVILKLERLCMAGNIVSIDLPSLKTLHLKGVYLQNSQDLKKLLHASLVLEDLYVMVGYKDSASIPPTRVDLGPYHVLFKARHYDVNYLQLEVKLPNENMTSYLEGTSVFQNITRLDLLYCHYYGWDDLESLLHHCPNLQILRIDKITKKFDHDWLHVCEWTLKVNRNSYTSWKRPIYVPKCISSQLKSFTVIYRGGRFFNMIQFAIYVLQNAQLLQDMIIKVPHSLSSVSKTFSDELHSVPKISSICKISIDYDI